MQLEDGGGLLVRLQCHGSHRYIPGANYKAGACSIGASSSIHSHVRVRIRCMTTPVFEGVIFRRNLVLDLLARTVSPCFSGFDRMTLEPPVKPGVDQQ